MTKTQTELLAKIQKDEDLNRWLYYSIAYNNGKENAARDFVSKCYFNQKFPFETAPTIADIKAIIPQFIKEYDK